MSEQLILDLGRPEPPTFANFVPGANGEALAALSALAAGDLRETGILLWGASGGGKSHLLCGTAATAAATRPVIHCVSPGSLPRGEMVPGTLLVVDAADAADAD
ncbi:MAG TPA: DnaA regulatory inactivator Hda, partial [Casimicrobiaceae bacterium]